MNGLPSLAAAFILSLFASFATVVYLRRRLSTILTELCGTVERARFWTALSNLAMVLTPLMFSMFAFPEDSIPEFSLSLLAGQLRRVLLGLLLTLLSLAVVIGSFISRSAAEAKSSARGAVSS